MINAKMVKILGLVATAVISVFGRRNLKSRRFRKRRSRNRSSSNSKRSHPSLTKSAQIVLLSMLRLKRHQLPNGMKFQLS